MQPWTNPQPPCTHVHFENSVTLDPLIELLPKKDSLHFSLSPETVRHSSSSGDAVKELVRWRKGPIKHERTTQTRFSKKREKKKKKRADLKWECPHRNLISCQSAKWESLLANWDINACRLQAGLLCAWKRCLISEQPRLEYSETRDCSHVTESWSNENQSVFYLNSSFLMWQDTTCAVCRHQFVISHPSSCSLGLLSLKSFKSSAQQSVWRRHLTTGSQTIYRPSL